MYPQLKRTRWLARLVNIKLEHSRIYLAISGLVLLPVVSLLDSEKRDS
jgi:hypothetical protein